MMAKQPDMAPWKLYTTITVQSLVIFYLATFLVALYFTTTNFQTVLYSILVATGYLTIIGLILRNVARKFSPAALMLIVPIAPLIALIFIVTMLPVLEWLR